MMQELLVNAVLVDTSEPREMFEAIAKRVSAIRKRLDVGDYIVGRFIIERKSRDDLMNSIADGRLFSQVDRMLEHGKAVLLVEGKSENITPSVKAGVLARLVVKGVSIVCTDSKEESAIFISKIAEKMLEEERTKEAIGKKPKDVEEQRKFVLKALPGVGEKLAEELLKKFGSIENIAKASEEDLMKVEKLGKKKAKKIVEVLRGRV